MPAESRINAPQITDIISTNLREIRIYLPLPVGMVGMIAKRNRQLASCCFRSETTDDDDLRWLSRCERLHTLRVRSRNKITDFTCLTRHPELRELGVDYSVFKYITAQLLSAFVHYSILERIYVVGFENWRFFKDIQLCDVSNVGVDFLPYIEKTTWKQFVVRLDRARIKN